MPKQMLSQRFIDRIKPSNKTQEVYDTKVSNLYLRVYPSGKVNYFVRFQHDGLRQNQKLGSTNELSLSQARLKAKTLINQTRCLVTNERPVVTLRAFSVEFFERYSRHWKPKTLEKNESAFRLHIAPLLGERWVHTIERQDVEQWFSQLSHIKATANQSLVLLSVMMQQCEVWGYRDNNTNPCRRFKRYKEKGRERYLTPDELRQLWRALEALEHGYPIAVMVIRLLVYTGCRSSEVRTLRWDEYRGGHWHLSDSKTGAKTVYLCSQVREYLAHWSSDSEYLFHGRDRGQPLPKHALTQVWKLVCQDAKLEDVRLHDLRHTYASLALQSKVNLYVLSRLLGHADPETTLRYVHLSHEDAYKAASHVSKVLVKGMKQ
ncbi:tyrosine-type recombinase/integrase [Vibrio mediterranei]|uniref:tyrosine-type recombinase/integrase n=1 Tax=Vibrio mediterranei TaxID=689 RepID=UPI002284F60C|nr:site-specific integrase [Vibrio mediterranei]MCY9855992.1 tyrosine-type recombinase/integrase [Vibrio mediterranei]